MRFRLPLAYMVCAGLTACGVTSSDSGSGNYTYVSQSSDGAIPQATLKNPAGNSNINTTGVNTGSGGDPNGSQASNTTTGGSTTAGGNTTAGTGGSSTGNSNTTTNPPAPTYTVQNLSADMTSVLQAHTPIYSTENLGNPANVSLWGTTQLQSLYDGLVTTQGFYPNLSLTDLAHLVLALGATDSTGDYRLVNGSSTGYVQVAASSCQADYTNHGVAINGPNGEILNPSNIPLTTPGPNVVIMAWYTRNAVSAGESANEAASGLHDHVVTRDVGNAILSWLVGPGQDRHTSPPSNWPAFYNRLKDYYVQANFGDANSFDAILDTSMPSTLVSFKDAPAGAFP